MAEMMRLQIVTPDEAFFDGEVSMVELNTADGEAGIYPKHIPMVVAVAPGVLKIHGADGVKKAALLSGFLQILPEKVTILAEACEWPENIDGKRANEARIRAERRLAEKNPQTDIDRAEAALKRALVRLSLETQWKIKQHVGKNACKQDLQETFRHAVLFYDVGDKRYFGAELIFSAWKAAAHLPHRVPQARRSPQGLSEIPYRRLCCHTTRQRNGRHRLFRLRRRRSQGFRG